MKGFLKSCRAALAVGGIVSGLALVPATGTWAGQGNPNPQVIPPHANAFGKSYAEWSAEWWKWQLSLPATDHPALSVDGSNCGVGQSGKVWFLTGAFTTEVSENEFATIVRESCSVPTGKAIFFPIVNAECSTIEAKDFKLVLTGSTQNVGACASRFVDGDIAYVDDLSVTIDGRSLTSLEAYRVESGVFGFNFQHPDDNILGANCEEVNCDHAKAQSDGYWIMLPPLSKGMHTIRFTGSFRDASTENYGGLFFGLDVTYNLNVVGGGK